MKRYSSDRDGAMDEYDDGEYVRYEDVVELQRQLAEEKAKHDETLTAGEKVLAVTEELQRQLAEARDQLRYERENPTAAGHLDTWQAVAGKARREAAELQHQLLDVRTLCASVLGDAADLQRQLAEREREIADLIHPHDLAKYRSAK